jgi:hypothetical protein
VHVQVGQSVVFRKDGRVSHAECPPVICPVCSRTIRPEEPIRRDGDGLVHGNCWVRRYRTQRRAAEIAAGAHPDTVTIVHDKIAAGLLPMAPHNGEKVWAGQGSGQICDGCDRPIPASAVECEIDIADRTLRFHRACLAAWQGDGSPGPAIGGGSAASPWTLVFDPPRVPKAYEELLIAGTETRLECAAVRARSVAARTRSAAARARSCALQDGSKDLRIAARLLVASNAPLRG